VFQKKAAKGNFGRFPLVNVTVLNYYLLVVWKWQKNFLARFLGASTTPQDIEFSNGDGRKDA
jgi:hypothetical protein